MIEAEGTWFRVENPSIFDDDQGDTITYRGPDGRKATRPVAASPEEIRQRDIRDLYRELEGVEFQLAHVEDPVPWKVTAEERAERRQGLEATKAAIFAKLDALGDSGPESLDRSKDPTRKRSRR